MHTEPHTPAQLHLNLPSQPGSVRRAADLLRKLLSAGGCSPEVMGEIELCAVEAMNNILEHAYGSCLGHAFEVTVWFDERGLVIELRDEGASIPPGKLEGLKLPEFQPDQLESLPEGGWGLCILRELMDEVIYETRPDCNVMRMVRRNGLTSSR
ncbi:ATP-binding protein [Hyalangium versicolor]|uniref:ATP-binding protein n=1 Tax=Hyalangium versicolor TaxID=2861190 RepID=UPI001CCBA347|nr:ATP-binding protein [Hyalangium versicolor]